MQFTITGIGDQNFSTDNCHTGFCGFTTTNLSNGTIFYALRSIEIPVTANVGDVLTISATLGISGTAKIVNGNLVNGDGNVIHNWADARYTAGIWLGTLPNGITVTSTDGHDYTIDPTQGEESVAPAQVAAIAIAGDALAIVSFAAPLGTGAAAITDYTVTSSPGGITASGPGSPIAVRGLTNGTAYTFTVTSKNAAGTSTVSAPTNSVTPDASLAPGPASAPIIGVASAGDGQASVDFTAPAMDGGSTITGYTVSSIPDGITATGTAAPITVTGLTNGTAYTFTVTASNAIGTSAESSPSNSVTPAGTVSPTPSPATHGGGGSTSILVLVAMAVLVTRRLRDTQSSNSSKT